MQSRQMTIPLPSTLSNPPSMSPVTSMRTKTRAIAYEAFVRLSHPATCTSPLISEQPYPATEWSLESVPASHHQALSLAVTACPV